MFPLRRRYLIRGCAKHRAGIPGVLPKEGCAADYKTTGIWLGDLLSWSKKRLRAPFSGICWAWNENTGGKWVSVQRKNGDVIQMAHLSERFVSSVKKHVEKGQLIAYTGNTGDWTTGYHLHIQIKDKSGKRLDPVKYFAENP